MAIDKQTQDDLFSARARERYREVMNRWLAQAAGREADSDHAHIHAVIDAHNDWSDRLGRVVDATHHH